MRLAAASGLPSLLLVLLLDAGCGGGSPQPGRLDTLARDADKFLLIRLLPLGTDSGGVRRAFPLMRTRGAGPDGATGSARLDAGGNPGQVVFRFQAGVLSEYEVVLPGLDSVGAEILDRSLVLTFVTAFGNYHQEIAHTEAGSTLTRFWTGAGAGIWSVKEVASGRWTVRWHYRPPAEGDSGGPALLVSAAACARRL
ncbi:MAG: hypothetical protein WB626_09140 [Bacteroidota bacterium]